MDLLANDALEDGGLTVVRFDREDERQDYVLTMKTKSTAPTTAAKTRSGHCSRL